MTIEQAVLDNLKSLPLGKKKEVLEFTESLAAKERTTEADHQLPFNGELSRLDENELTHLELEFENYDELYPLQ